MNIILNSDSYKSSHYCQYPSDTQFVSSYIEARGGVYPQLVFFGLQAFLKEYLLKPISAENIIEAKAIITAHGLPFYESGWQYILEQHAGFLPLTIEAVPEGSVLPTGNVLCQVQNTDPNCFWLTNYVETALLRAIWYPTTVATRAYAVRQIINYYLTKTTDNLANLEFMLHDFGARGASSYESSMLGGMAHLTSFTGTDNLAALTGARKYYHADMAGYSVPAAEHSTIVSWGSAREAKAYQHILSQFAEFPAVSIVSDSYDLYSAITNIWAGELKDVVANYPGVFVLRPDSGEPVQVVQKCLTLLTEHFGFTTNSKGYKVLPDNLRLIQGDGISEASIEAILAAITEAGFSAENLIFGMGAELLQKVNRDTLSFAMKASAISNGKAWLPVAKTPKTDSFKTSRSGVLALVDNKTILRADLGNAENMLVPIYENGKLLQDYDWQAIKARVRHCAN